MWLRRGRHAEDQLRLSVVQNLANQRLRLLKAHKLMCNEYISLQDLFDLSKDDKYSINHDTAILSDDVLRWSTSPWL